MTHTVMLAGAEIPDLMTVAKALASVHGTPVQDQINKARSAWGIVAENLEEAAAADLAKRLSAAGVPCIVAAAKAMATLTEPLLVGKLDLTPTGWNFFAAGGKTHAVDADQLTLIAATGIKVTSTSTSQVKEGPNAAQKMLSTGLMLATGLPIKIGGKEKIVQKVREESDTLYILDLLTRHPIQHVRIEAHRFDYAVLKDRKGYVAFGNFKTLLGDFVKACPAAATNHGTRIFLSGKPQQNLGYASLADLDRESRWLLTLAQQPTR